MPKQKNPPSQNSSSQGSNKHPCHDCRKQRAGCEIRMYCEGCGVGGCDIGKQLQHVLRTYLTSKAMKKDEINERLLEKVITESNKDIFNVDFLTSPLSMHDANTLFSPCEACRNANRPCVVLLTCQRCVDVKKKKAQPCIPEAKLEALLHFILQRCRSSDPGPSQSHPEQSQPQLPRANTTPPSLGQHVDRPDRQSPLVNAIHTPESIVIDALPQTDHQDPPIAPKSIEGKEKMPPAFPPAAPVGSDGNPETAMDVAYTNSEHMQLPMPTSDGVIYPAPAASNYTTVANQSQKPENEGGPNPMPVFDEEGNFYPDDLLDGRAVDQTSLDRAEYPTPSTNATHNGDFGPSLPQLLPTTVQPSNDGHASLSDQADPFSPFATDGDGDTPFGVEAQQVWPWYNVLGDYQLDGSAPIQSGAFDYFASGDQHVPPDYHSAARHNTDVGTGTQNYQGSGLYGFATPSTMGRDVAELPVGTPPMLEVGNVNAGATAQDNHVLGQNWSGEFRLSSTPEGQGDAPLAVAVPRMDASRRSDHPSSLSSVPTAPRSSSTFMGYPNISGQTSAHTHAQTAMSAISDLPSVAMMPISLPMSTLKRQRPSPSSGGAGPSSASGDTGYEDRDGKGKRRMTEYVWLPQL